MSKAVTMVKFLYQNKWKGVFYSNCYYAGVKYMYHLVKTSHHAHIFYTLQEFNQLYGVNLDIMRYNSILHAIPYEWKKKIRNGDLEDTYNYKIDKVVQMIKPVKLLYSDLIQDKYVEPEHVFVKWEQEECEKEDVLEAFQNIYGVTISTKLRYFQFKILHRIVALNPYLVKAGLCDSELCFFCNGEKETLTHVFYYCTHVSELWRDVFNWLAGFGIPRIFSKKVVLMNVTTDRLLDKIILLVKYYIYVTKCKKLQLSFSGAVKYIKIFYNIERSIAICKGKLAKHDILWGELGQF